jgi:hypothetical protein
MRKNDESDLKLGPNLKIIFHWTIVIIFIGLLISLFELNPNLSLILIGFLLLSIGLNKTTYIKLSDKNLTIIKKNLLFITTFKKQFDLKTIKKIWIKELSIDDSPFRYNSDYIGFKIVIGTAFYNPRFLLKSESNDNEIIEIPINTQKVDIKKLSIRLEKAFKADYKYEKLDLNTINELKREIN